MVYSYFRDDPDGGVVRELIACALREVADEVCRDHVRTISQEAQITSRIGQALETRLRGSNFNGYTIEVVTQDIPDRGRGALERRLGGDIYVGIRVMHGSSTALSKGFLAQAKRGPHLSSSERNELVRQSLRLLFRSPSSYVWVYTERRVRVVNAEDVVRRQSRNLVDGRRLDEIFSETLSCLEGDIHIGLPPGSDVRSSVGIMLERLRTQTAIGIAIASGSDR
jgi:hypothetical protein